MGEARSLAWPLRLLVVGGLLAGAVSLWWVNDPVRHGFSFDNQIYFFQAEQVADGVPPHVSLVDHKHALPGIVSGVGIVIGRMLGVADPMAVRVVALLVAAGTVVCVWLLAGALFERNGPALGAGLAMLVFDDFFQQAAVGVRPQQFMAFFMVAALLAVTHRRWLAAGALAAASFLCWQPALLITAAIATASISQQRRWRAAWRTVAGFAIAALAYELYFLAHGALREQLYQTFVMPADLGGYTYPKLGESLAFLLRMGLWRQDIVSVLPGTFLAVMLALVVLLIVRPRRTLRRLTEQPQRLAVAASAAGALAFTFVNHQAFPDMFFVQPFIALAVGAAVAGAERLLAGSRLRPARIALVAAVCISMVTLAYGRRNLFGPTGGALTLERQYQLARQVDLLEEVFGSVWAIGCPHLLALNRMGNYDPFGLMIDPKVRAYMQRLAGGGVYRPRAGVMPAVILTSRGGQRPALSWLTREYAQLSNASFKKQGVLIWVRRQAWIHPSDAPPLTQNGR